MIVFFIVFDRIIYTPVIYKHLHEMDPKKPDENRSVTQRMLTFPEIKIRCLFRITSHHGSETSAIYANLAL